MPNADPAGWVLPRGRRHRLPAGLQGGKCRSAGRAGRGEFVPDLREPEDQRAARCARVEETAKGGSRLTVTVSFEYADKSQKKPLTWTDEAVLVNEGGRWVVDDVFYRMKAAFGNGFGGSHREGLAGQGC